MFFREFLNEVHWTDSYPKGFHEFRKKYLKISKTPEGKNLYVQFTSHQNDDMSKTGYDSPDHHDPKGIYAYHLSYVVNHPSDVWYGKSAKYLRVLENKAKNKVVLNHMNRSDAFRYLYRMGLDANLLDYAIKTFKIKGSNQIGKAFVMVFQQEFEKEPTYHDLDTKKKRPNFPVRSNQEQTRLLLKAGIDALKDSSTRDSQAAINEREPEQIVFLHRSAFNVKEVYFLRQDKQYLVKDSPDKENAKKLASLIFDKLNDRIINWEDKLFFSKKGRKLTVNFERSASSMQGRKMGQKLHKDYKFHDEFRTQVELVSERGTTEGNFDTSTKFSEIADSIFRKWNDKSEIEWKPDNLKDYKQRLEDQRKSQFEKSFEEQKLKEIQEEKTFLPALQKVASKLGIPFTPSPGKIYNSLVQHIGQMVQRSGDRKNLQAFWKKSAEEYEKLKEHFPEENEYLIYTLGYFPANPPRDIAQLKEIINKIASKDDFWGVFSIYQELRNE